jgi:hypothetical protein
MYKVLTQYKPGTKFVWRMPIIPGMSSDSNIFTFMFETKLGLETMLGYLGGCSSTWVICTKCVLFEKEFFL